ncbi:unnamed protein product [[Candida] boidinii]|nr:unnamed protein product [[Candida] boidinii]
MIDEEDPKNLNLNNSINSKLSNTKKPQPQQQQSPSITNSPRQTQQPGFLSKTKSRTLSNNANISSNQTTFNRQNSTVSLSSSTSPPFLGRQDRQDSLIFERLVQDPMIASRPSLTNLPSHYSTEIFIPAALDQSAHALNTNEDLDNVELVYSSRRASTANLQAALTGNNNNNNNNNINGQLNSPISPNPEGFFNRSARGSVSSFRNSPFQPSSSYSNLTSALNGMNNNNNNNNNTSPTFPPTGAPMRHSVSHSGNMSLNTNTNTNNDNSNDPTSPIQPSLKPNKSTLSFFSYADMINQEDSESPFEIRRPSISQSLSQSFVSPGRLSRTSSVPSVRANSVSNINPFANSNNSNNNNNNNINNSSSITNGGGLSINTMLQNTTGSNSPSLNIARSPVLNRGYSNLRSNNANPINLLNNNNNNNTSNTPKKFSISGDSPSESSDNEDNESIGQKIPFPAAASSISGRSNSLAGLSRKTSHGPSVSGNNNNNNSFSVSNRSRLSISSSNSSRPIFYQQQQHQQQNLADALLNRTTSNSNSNNGDDEQSNFADDDESMHSLVTANVGETIRKYASEIQG